MGRPSKYNPAYCDQITEFMKDGASMTAFAAEIDVSRRTITEWMAEHEEFSLACACAKAKSAAWWEAAARSITLDGKGSAQLAMFGMKNMGADDWKEKALVGSDPDNPLPAGVSVTFKGTGSGD